MLFFDNLDKIIYERHKLIKCDDIIILSGYVGPAPIKRISEYPIHTTIIYGMYACDGIGEALHNELIKYDTHNNIDIYYSKVPVHSKIYMWRFKGEVVYALVGSANFSTHGLTIPYKEILAETTSDTLSKLGEYYQYIQEKCVRCTNAVFCPQRKKLQTIQNVSFSSEKCSLPLYITKYGIDQVPASSGLNWGMAKLNGSHVNIDDAYIAIPAEAIEIFPNLFPKKQAEPKNINNIKRRGHRDNDPIDIIWDDGTTMTGLLEGTRNVGNYEYPKQIATTPSKSILGKYLRTRMNISSGKQISLQDLDNYGRRTIDISLQGEGVYFFDFSV